MIIVYFHLQLLYFLLWSENQDFFSTLQIKKKEREREERNAEISAVLNTINDFADIFHVLNS